MNRGISSALASLRYNRVDDAVRFLFLSVFCGPVHLAKIDLESAYRMIPVHPANSAPKNCLGSGKRTVVGDAS